jgi:hypothetical protein
VTTFRAPHGDTQLQWSDASRRLGDAQEGRGYRTPERPSPVAGQCAYAFDVANFAMFPDDHGLTLADVTPTDLFGYLEWQSHRSPGGEKVVPMRQTAAAPATLNRRISAVLGLFE